MAEPLKNLFSREFFETFVDILLLFKKDVNKEEFLENIFDDTWGSLELKQRARHTSYVLNHYLTGDFQKDVEILISVIGHIQKNKNLKPGIESMFIPDYIEVFGIDSPEISLMAMEKITRFFSCEFSIRPFILKYPDKTLDRMVAWSLDPHPQVRRLSSEGCRPRLPWAMSIPFLKKNPDPILPILDNLKNDPSETVRKSVANNLNDISKDNPEIVIDLTKKWKGKSKNTDWILKHACRTLLKQAHPVALELFGYGSVDNIAMQQFKILTPTVHMGESLEFECTITNKSHEPTLIRLEYGLYFLKSNGSLSRKVFKISEKHYDPAERVLLRRKQSFKPISTRKYYSGEHKVSLIINGKEFEPHRFNLVLD